MTVEERRGGWRVDPIARAREALDRLTKRTTSSGLRGVHVRPDGFIKDWREVGATGEPVFQNSWVNHTGGNNATAAFRRDGEGNVHIKGLVKSGTGVIFNLPAGYRPLLDHNISVVSDDTNKPARLEVRLNGDVVHVNGGTTFFSIHCSFPAEQ